MYDWSCVEQSHKHRITDKVSVVVERMYDWSTKVPIRAVFAAKFQLLLKGCTIEAISAHRIQTTNSVSVVVERMYDWSNGTLLGFRVFDKVSVVVERMYDWSLQFCPVHRIQQEFQLLLKGCTIEAATAWRTVRHGIVSVVVERMYDWSLVYSDWLQEATKFQLLLKGCTIEAKQFVDGFQNPLLRSFSCCWKDVRLKRQKSGWKLSQDEVSVVVERMYDWSCATRLPLQVSSRFSCCWKDVRLKQRGGHVIQTIWQCFSCCWKDVRLKLTAVVS